jgi:hypothetical protein
MRFGRVSAREEAARPESSGDAGARIEEAVRGLIAGGPEGLCGALAALENAREPFEAIARAQRRPPASELLRLQHRLDLAVELARSARRFYGQLLRLADVGNTEYTRDGAMPAAGPAPAKLTLCG